ncbi:MAG: alanine racemase [Patescibacteria group bacterium]|jgi:alanine racemase|nr:alanine racemase [Patescibacteria group bacterium]
MYNSWVEISRSAIIHNLAQYQRLVGSEVAVMPIVKSNAYGHGMAEIARLVAPRVKWLGVVSLGEALELRRLGIKRRIFVLSYVSQQYLSAGIKQRIDLPIYDLESAKLINAVAGRLKIKARLHIKVDTGATRVGILTSQVGGFVQQLTTLPNLKMEGIYSHFAASEENQKYTGLQLKRFQQVLADLKIEIPTRHFACSAAILVEPKAHFNLIRLGLGLYGLWPSELVRNLAQKKYPGFELKPALTWKTTIIQVKTISAKTKIGYGCSYTAKTKMKIAVIAVGYWEGYDRHLSNKTEVLVGNKRCPLVGRICMNISMIDVSKVRDVKVGQEVVLLGKQGREEITAEELAGRIGTINYELVTRINPILERRYLD